MRPAGGGSNTSLREIDDKLLSSVLLTHCVPSNLAKAAVIHHALRRATRERLQSDLEATWLRGKDTQAALTIVENLCRRFPLFARQMQNRWDNRTPHVFDD